MDFEQNLELIWAACIINFFLFCISSIGLVVIQKSLKAWDDDSAVSLFFGCIFVVASFVLQWFVLANWLKSFY